MGNGHSVSQDLWDQQQQPRGFALADAPRLLSTEYPVSLTSIPRRVKEINKSGLVTLHFEMVVVVIHLACSR